MNKQMNIPINGATGRQNGIVLSAPRDSGNGEASGVALQLHGLPFADHQRLGGVVADDGRPAHRELHFGWNFAARGYEDLA